MVKIRRPPKPINVRHAPYNTFPQQDSKIILYHYTSQDGLIGIATSGRLWATNIHYLNDHTELNYALDLARNMFCRLTASDKYSHLNKYYRFLNDNISTISKIGIYIFSFTEEGDLLSQWRGYCPDCQGFSLGILLNDIQTMANRQGFKILRCIYDKDEQDVIVNKYVLNLLDSLDVHGKNMKEDDEVYKFIDEWLGEYLEVAPILKHWSFSEEKEWRLISFLESLGSNRLNVRKGKSSLIPFVEIEAGENLKFERIICGPTPHPEMAVNALFSFMNVHKIIHKSVSPSRVPYRNW